MWRKYSSLLLFTLLLPTIATCGDGTIDPGETCESQTDCQENETCTNCNCIERVIECGNSILEEGEDCDGTVICPHGEDCINCKCELIVEEAVCGNGKAEEGEQCDYAIQNSCPEGEECSQNCICIRTQIEPETQPDGGLETILDQIMSLITGLFS